MTTTAAPFGVRPSMHGSGGVIRPSRHVIDAGYSTALYKGTPVIVHTDGNINIAAANSGRIDGVFVGCEYTDATGKRNVSNYWPGTAGATNIVAWVYDDPNMIFEVQASATLAIATRGGGYGISASPGSGSTLTGVSTASLDAATAGTSAKQFMIVDIAAGEDNAWGDTFPIVRVKLGNSLFAAALTAI
jgi:hypothetical protein